MIAAFFYRTSLSRPSVRPCSNYATLRWPTLLILLLFSTSALPSQQTPDPKPSAPTVTFTIDFPQSNPTHYSIAVDADGHARYECTGRIDENSEDQAYRADFEMSSASRAKIFELAKQAHYFSGKIDSGNAKLAFTGAKVLTFQDGQRSNTARYNYSNQEPVRELTTLFQSMAGTLEYGRRLAYFHRYQKLALDEELKRMESQATNKEIGELNAVAPILQEIFDDSSVINVVRARAKNLLQIGNHEAGAH